MKKSEVSPEFMSFFGRNATRIEESKKAESRLANIPLPVGAAGTCIITDFKCGKSKDKPQADGTVKEGTPFISLTLNVVDSPDHQGKRMTKTYWLSANASMDAATKYEMFLNDMEKIGLPREVRVNHETPSEIGDYFLSREGHTVHFNVVEDKYQSLDDFKSIRLSVSDSHIPQNDSVVPPSTPRSSAPPSGASVAAPSAPAATTSSPQKGSTVKYLEQDWTVIDVFADSNKVQIKSVDDPRMEKIVAIANLDS